MIEHVSVVISRKIKNGFESAYDLLLKQLLRDAERIDRYLGAHILYPTIGGIVE